MPRKAEPAYKTEDRVFPRRLREIMKERGENQTTLAKKITEQYSTIQRQTISLYMNGQSKPDTERLTAIAKVLDVSSDWLLGISDCQSTDFNVRKITETIGISEETIASLILQKKHLDPLYMEAFNDFFSPVYMQEMLAYLWKIRKSTDTLKEIIISVRNEIAEIEAESPQESKKNNDIHTLSLSDKSDRLDAEIKELRLHRFETAEYLSSELDCAYEISETIENARDAIGDCGQYM